MNSMGTLDAMRSSSAAEYRKYVDDVAAENSRKLTKQRTLTDNDIDALAVLEYAAQDILQKYHAAMRQAEVRLETLDQDLKLRKHRNPIHHIESRMKSVPSIFEKLQRYGKEPTLEDMERHVMDIAGLRVICSYVEDAYSISGMLQSQDDLEVVKVKDYIAYPKPNGYRSLHLVVKVPVYFLDRKEHIPVEIQIRTVAMDFWASLEHDLKYKAVRPVEGIDAHAELLECSYVIREIEERMQVLAHALETEHPKHPVPMAPPVPDPAETAEGEDSEAPRRFSMRQGYAIP